MRQEPCNFESHMKPRKPPIEQDDLLRARLIEMIDMRHELVKLAVLIDWEVFERNGGEAGFRCGCKMLLS